jgi:hypothetical protein
LVECVVETGPARLGDKALATMLGEQVIPELE